jgi:hypothetical protein
LVKLTAPPIRPFAAITSELMLHSSLISFIYISRDCVWFLDTFPA